MSKVLFLGLLGSIGIGIAGVICWELVKTVRDIFLRGGVRPTVFFAKSAVIIAGVWFIFQAASLFPSALGTDFIGSSVSWALLAGFSGFAKVSWDLVVIIYCSTMDLEDPAFAAHPRNFAARLESSGALFKPGMREAIAGKTGDDYVWRAQRHLQKTAPKQAAQEVDDEEDEEEPDEYYHHDWSHSMLHG